MTVTEQEQHTDDPTEADLEQDQHEKPEPDPEKGELFSKEEYDSPPLALPYIDDKPIEKLAVKFSGTVYLDRGDPRDVALYRRLKLGRDVDLKIEARVSKSIGEQTTDREGELDVVVGAKGLRVHSLDIPAGEL